MKAKQETINKLINLVIAHEQEEETLQALIDILTPVK